MTQFFTDLLCLTFGYENIDDWHWPREVHEAKLDPDEIYGMVFSISEDNKEILIVRYNSFNYVYTLDEILNDETSEDRIFSAKTFKTRFYDNFKSSLGFDKEYLLPNLKFTDGSDVILDEEKYVKYSSTHVDDSRLYPLERGPGVMHKYFLFKDEDSFNKADYQYGSSYIFEYKILKR